MRLAELILHHAGNEVEDIAIVLRAGIHDVNDVEATDGFLRGNLRGVDRGRRFVHIDDLANFLLVRDGDFDGGTGRDFDRLEERIETFFFDPE